LFFLLALAPFVLSCASGVAIAPVKSSLPRSRAQRIYERLLAREGRSERRDPQTLAGFPEAPLDVARQLEVLAGSRRGREREALLELAKALKKTGLYSKVTFRTRPSGAIVKYKPIALNEAKTAHAGSNVIPIGLYEVWMEREGSAISVIDEYEFIEKEIVINLSANADASKTP
jgi:hypothetical protein